MDITIYANECSHHLAPIATELANHHTVGSVTFIAESALSLERRKQGWLEADRRNFNYLERLNKSDVIAYVRDSPADSIHIFAGMRHMTCVTAGIAACIRYKRRFGLLHEPRVKEGWRGKLRFLESWATEHKIRSNAFVLAIGAWGPSWFLSTGYRNPFVFPFAYFTEVYAKELSTHRIPIVRIGYLGRLEEAKGIMDLLDSLIHIDLEYSLSIAGYGSKESECRSIALKNSRVNFVGVIPANRVDEYLDELDILIQPSRTTDDGWGVVVSEALQRGVAVIATDVVGASMCLSQNELGRIVPPNDSLSIAKAVRSLSDSGDLLPERRQMRSNWAISHITAQAGAIYLVEIINYLYNNGCRPESFLSKAYYAPDD